MIKQFEIHGGVKKELQSYLSERNTDLQTAMDSETLNRDVAAIIHNGLPAMVRKIYPLEKMQKFFWEKKELMLQFVAARLSAAEGKPKNAGRQKR